MPAPEVETPKVETKPQEENEQQPMREITQTDHLNKKLLTSLLQRLNEGGDSLLSKMLEPDEETQENNEWKD